MAMTELFNAAVAGIIIGWWMALFVARRRSDAAGKIELRDGRKFLRLACGAIVRKLDARDIDQLLRRCLTPNLGGLRKGDVVVFCYHDCVHCDRLAGCDKAFAVRRVGVRPQVDGRWVSVLDDESVEMLWVSPGIDDADHVPIAVGPVVKAFLVHEKRQMWVVVPPVSDGGDEGDERGRGGDESGRGDDGLAPGLEEIQDGVSHGDIVSQKQEIGK